MINESEIKRLIEEVDEGPTLDYKEELVLETNGDKAQFVKDVISLANSRESAHIITGVEDGTRKLLGIKIHHQAEQLNQILKDKSDPPLRVEYIEKKIMGHTIGVIEIAEGNPPYIVAVPDRYGGPISSDPQKLFHIERGTVFIRNYNMNEGARRADLDKMYKVKYVTLEADLRINHEASVKTLDDSKEVDITFFLVNLGEALATDTLMWVQFRNTKEIVRCKSGWKDISNLNNNIPTVQLPVAVPIMAKIKTQCSGLVVKVDKDIQQIEMSVIIGATNMRTKEGTYVIPLQEVEPRSREGNA